MANVQQIKSIIEILHHRTMSGDIVWERSAQAGKFVCRLGEFSIILSPSMIASRSDGATLVDMDIRKLDGTVVERTSPIRSPRKTTTEGEETARLSQIYDFINSGNPDLDDLLDYLKRG